MMRTLTSPLADITHDNFTVPLLVPWTRELPLPLAQRIIRLTDQGSVEFELSYPALEPSQRALAGQ